MSVSLSATIHKFELNDEKINDRCPEVSRPKTSTTTTQHLSEDSSKGKRTSEKLLNLILYGKARQYYVQFTGQNYQFSFQCYLLPLSIS